VAGRVLTQDGAPIADAKVTLHDAGQPAVQGAPDPPAVASATSKSDGSFLVGPAPTGRLKLRAHAKGYAPGLVTVPRRGAVVEIRLDVGGRLQVKAVDAAGTPVAGAAVLHQAGLWNAQVVSEAVTGTDGSALFESVPTGNSSVVVSKAGLGTARRNEVGVSPERLTDVVLVLQGGRALTGTVTSALDKRPVSGAAVVVRYPGLPDQKPAAPALTDELGEFRTTADVAVGDQFELRVSHAGFAEVRHWFNYNDGGTGAMVCEIVLDLAVPGVSGRVLTADGVGAPGAEVTYGQRTPGQVFPSTRSGAEGRFDLAPPAWGGPGSQWWVVALHPTEGVGSAHVGLPQRNATQSVETDIRLTGTGRVHGIVRDAAGAPVAGCAVALQPDWSGLQRPSGRGRNADWLVFQLLSDVRVAARLTAVTDADGRFSIEAVPAATYAAQATWGAQQGAPEAPLDVLAGQVVETSITLGDGQSIEGRVTDLDGRPIAGAQVWSQQINPRGGGAFVQARAQSDGRFRLAGVAAGAHQVFALASGFVQVSVTSVAAGTHDLALRLKPLAWIEGRLLLDERPFAGTFTVTGKGLVDDASLPDDARLGNEAQASWAFNDAEGRFLLPGLAGGEWSLTASTGDGLVVVEAVSVRVTEGRGAGPVTLRLTRGAVLVGEVQSADGRPLEGAWVWGTPQGDAGVGPSAGGRSDRSGQVRVVGLGRGTYRLTVSTRDGTVWTEHVDVAPGAEQRVRLRERLAGRVAVTVLGPDDAPLARARPTLHDAAGSEIPPNWQRMRNEGIIDGRTQESWDRNTTTDANGRIVRHHVPPGRYRVGAVLEGWIVAGEAPWIEVASGAMTEVTVVLRRTP
jgi:protocatechuate 3,4-dioxygenase beta subunit